MKTMQELGEELCLYCPCTEFGLTKVSTGPWNLCEGRSCDEAYENYCYETESEGGGE